MTQREEGARQRIINAAGAVFAEHGFERATIREIVTRAEVNLAAVNYHFGDKENLYRATIRYAHEMAAGEVPFPHWDADTPPEVRLRDFVHTMTQRMLITQRLPWHSRLMMREMTHPSRACREVAEEFIRPIHQLLRGILDAMLPADTPSHRRDQMVFSLIGQCLFYKVSRPIVEVLVPADELANHFGPRELADHVSDVMLAALGRQPLFSSSLVNSH